jgi:ABC-type phosphate transport system permease subunit
MTPQQIIEGITTMILQPIISLLFAAGFLVFMWGMVEFIANPTDPTKKSTGKRHMIAGVLGLLIMVSIWGIVGIITDVIGVSCEGLKSGKPCE